MELSLYDSDLSLFNGDVLLGLSPPADVEQFQSPLAQYTGDGLKKQRQPSLGGDLGDVFTFEHNAQDLDPFGALWLDTKVDLLDLLADTSTQNGLSAEANNVDSQYTSLNNVGTVAVDKPSDGATVFDLLQSLANDNNSTMEEVVAPAVSPAEQEINGSRALLEMLLDGQPQQQLEIQVVEEKDPTSALLELLTANLDVDSITVPGMVNNAPILSPVTPEDVESLLSSGRNSPDLDTSSLMDSSSVMDTSSVYDDNLSDPDWEMSPNPEPKTMTKRSPRNKSKPRPAPYTSKKPKVDKETRILDRKERKKQQNRDAALRYRQKKRDEGNVHEDECQILEKRNSELKEKVDQMTREIQYLKDLMTDVYKAKGLLK